MNGSYGNITFLLRVAPLFEYWKMRRLYLVVQTNFDSVRACEGDCLLSVCSSWIECWSRVLTGGEGGGRGEGRAYG